MRLLKWFILICSVLSLAACASGTDYKHLAASIPKLKADEGRIYFFRNTAFAGFAVQPSITLDGANVGRSKPGGFFYVDIPSGQHEISTASEPSKKLAVTLEKGETQYIKASPAFGTMMGTINLQVVPEADAMKELSDLASNVE